MTKKDSVHSDTKRRRKGAKVTESGSPHAAETGVAPFPPTTKSVDTKHHASMKRSQWFTACNNDVEKTLNLSEVNQLEANLSQNIAPIDDISSYRKTCQEIELLVTEVDHLKDARGRKDNKAINGRRIRAVLLTLSLKRLNRLALIRSKTARRETQEMKQKVDSLYVDLQNLLYEVAHMKKDIKKCTEFTSKDEEIDLIEVQAFYDQASPELSRPEVTMNNYHVQMLARLEWELCQRKKLASLKNQLLGDKLTMEKEISKQAEVLNSLKPSIFDILRSTIPLQEKLGVKIDEMKAQYETAPFLPKPLYVLYVQAKAYCERDDGDISVNIVGDIQAAKALFGNEIPSLDEYEDSDSEEGNDFGDKEEYKRRKNNGEKERTRREDHKRAALQKHPLQIHITVTCKDSMVIRLVVGYLTCMKIVTVSTSLECVDDGQVSVPKSSVMLSSDHILKHLFGEDDPGEDSPNISNQIKMDKIGLEKFSAYITVLGRPYRWAQRLSGLCYLPKDQEQIFNSNHSCQSQDFAYTVKAIQHRVAARVALQKQLMELDSLRVPFNSSMFPSCIQAKLVEWQSITSSNFLDFCYSNCSKHRLEDGDLFYTMRLRDGKDELVGAVCIGIDYPWQPPFFVIAQPQSTHHNDFAKVLECELNVNFMDLVDLGGCGKILSLQLHKLMACFDVYCNTGDPEFKKHGLYIRKRRGRDRSRSCKYISEKSHFVY